MTDEPRRAATAPRADAAPRAAHAAPARRTAPARSPAPAQGTAAAQRTTPVQGTTPAQRTTPVQGTTPAQRTTPVQGTTPAHGASPARGGPPGRDREDAPQHSRRGTRERIQAVALELFAEQGYDATSLREIAERLGVTKAALYYHFQSKEDIVRSFSREYRAELDELIAWGSQQPRTAASRAAILARYADIVGARLGVIRFIEQNQATLHSLMGDGEERKKMFREQLAQLRDLVTPPGADLRERVRATLSIFTVAVGCMLYQSEAASPEELHDVLLGIATELAQAQPASQ